MTHVPGERARLGLANAYLAAGEGKLAETALRHALERPPDSTVVLNNLAHTLSESGRSAEALKLIERIGKPGPYAKKVSDTRALILERLGESPARAPVP